MVKRILFVDDEKQILRALKRLFVHSDYEVNFANSAKEALDILKEQEVELLITDIRMPEMDGFELLKEVKSLYPLTLRVALSGYTDNNKIYNALEDNLAKIYLFKPWDNKELIGIIDRLFELESILKNKNLLNLINNVDELPTVPNLYTELCNLVENDANVDLISKKLEEDQSISSRILRVANSAFYGAKTGSISQAIMYIGLTNVKNIVLSNAIFTNFVGNKEVKDKLWSHVNISNKLMNVIYQKCLYKKVPNMYASAGLLHDVGRVIILQFFKEEYDEIIRRSEEENVETYIIEEEILGVDHQKIGGYLLNWWEIPIPIVEAAMYHHDPLNEHIINKELVQVVHIANYYSWKLVDSKTNSTSLNLRVLEELNIDSDLLSQVIADFESSLQI
ncbi:MAG: response regulator [Acidaminobacteraceae bacterium]